MNLTITPNNNKQKTSFTSFSPEIQKALAEVTPYQRKVAMAACGLTKRMYRAVENSSHELKVQTQKYSTNATNNDKHFVIGNYNTNFNINHYGSLAADNVFAGIRRGYIALKNYIEPGTKIITEKEGKIITKKQKLEAEISELKAKADRFDSDSKEALALAQKMEYKENDVYILDNILEKYKDISNKNRPFPWENISKREYKANLQYGYKEIDEQYKYGFSKYKTSTFRQNLDEKVDLIKYVFKLCLGIAKD